MCVKHVEIPHVVKCFWNAQKETRVNGRLVRRLILLDFFVCQFTRWARGGWVGVNGREGGARGKEIGGGRD